MDTDDILIGHRNFENIQTVIASHILQYVFAQL
jgi:hypothetical protein